MLKYINKEIKDINERQGIVQVYANAFNNLDADGDVSLPGSFTKTLKEGLKRMRWLLNHDIDKLLGVPFIDGGVQDNWGLLATNKFNFKKQIAKDTFEDYLIYKEFNRTLEHSIRVKALKYEVFEGKEIPKEYREQARENNFNSVRLVKEWQMLEMSTVLWGANEKTPLVDIKSLEDINSTIALLEKMLKGNYSDERYKQIELTLNVIKSLIKEPIDSTLKEPDKNTQREPIDICEMLDRHSLFKTKKNG